MTIAAGVASIALMASMAGGDVRADDSRAPPPPAGRPRTIARAPRPVPARAVPAKAAEPSLDLSARVIRQAIADSRDPLDDVAVARGVAFGAGDATARAATDQAFRRAEIPTCLTPEAYRFDPPQIGFLGLGGLLALPFLVHAIATGQCRH